LTDFGTRMARPVSVIDSIVVMAWEAIEYFYLSGGRGIL